MTSPEKEKDMIVKEPGEDDVLLGQGHYRHRGNQNLNKMVDGKLDEYKNQSRVFKTYMAADIINRMRSKGVRFLKELGAQSDRGWIVVKDDKEAREKVAQRFQYMMRKQANAAAKSATSPPAPRPNLNWNGISVKVPFLPVFHQLQKSSVLVDDDAQAISNRLLECFYIIGVEEKLNSEEASAVLTITDTLKMQMNLWKPLGGNHGVIVELINLVGDTLKFQKYSRYILEAATGLFDKYKHTLFQSGAAASVQDHVTAFTTTKPSSRIGLLKAFSDRALQDPNCLIRFPVGKRFDHPKHLPRLIPLAPRPPKLLPIAPKPTPALVRRETDVTSETGARTGCFASTFSRWETGVESGDKMMDPADGQTSARRTSVVPPPKSLPTSTNHPNFAFNVESYNSGPGMPRQLEAKVGDAFDPQPTKMPFVSARNQVCFPSVPLAVHGLLSATVAQHNDQDAKPNAPVKASQIPSTATSSAEKGNSSTTDAGPAAPTGTTSSFNKREATTVIKVQGNKSFKPKFGQAQGAPEASEIEGQSTDPSSVFGSVSGADAGTSAMRNGEDERPALDRWSAGLTSNEEMKCEDEMKCDVNNEERLDTEMPFVDQTIQSIKRLSISSNDASCVDTRTSREFNDALVGFWSGALTNQEMKCDSSLDDEPYQAGNLSATQSFIPSSFFGAAAPAFSNLRPNPPSPAHSFCSHISIEMRSLASPSPSSSSHVSVELFSLPSRCGSFNSHCSLGMNSLKYARMDEAPSPTMFQFEPSAEDEAESERLGPLGISYDSRGRDRGCDVVPPTIYVDSSSSILEHTS